MKRETKNKIFTTSLVSLMLISFLSSCTSVKEEKSEINNYSSQISSEKLDKLKQWYSSKNMSSISSDWDAWKLKVSSRCIGCGKCVRVAPDYFIMNKYNKADTINQENLDSTDVNRAIDICPVWAISIG